jgi:NADPH:quinone reductase-like Zn-dependent oxidoreductase
MKAIVYRGTGDASVIAYADVPDPIVGSDDALVEVAYAGLNRADVLERLGTYGAAGSGRDVIPGLEFSGIVREIGANVKQLGVGERVCGLVAAGAHAQYVATNAAALANVPSGFSLRDAAAIPEAFITAHDALFTLGRTTLGSNVLVHAVGSGVGLAASALAKRAGALVVGTSRTTDKLERAREHGLDFGFVLDDGWRGRAIVATGGRGFDVVLDFVGAPMLADNVVALATGGCIVQIGTLGGAVVQNFHLGLLMAKRGTLVGTMLRSRPLFEKVALTRDFERLVLPLFARGELRATVDAEFPLERMAEAHAHMEGNANFGKVVLAVAGEDE